MFVFGAFYFLYVCNIKTYVYETYHKINYRSSRKLIIIGNQADARDGPQKKQQQQKRTYKWNVVFSLRLIKLLLIVRLNNFEFATNNMDFETERVKKKKKKEKLNEFLFMMQPWRGIQSKFSRII